MPRKKRTFRGGFIVGKMIYRSVLASWWTPGINARLEPVKRFAWCFHAFSDLPRRNSMTCQSFVWIRLGTGPDTFPWNFNDYDAYGLLFIEMGGNENNREILSVEMSLSSWLGNFVVNLISIILVRFVLVIIYGKKRMERFEIHRVCWNNFFFLVKDTRCSFFFKNKLFFNFNKYYDYKYQWWTSTTPCISREIFGTGIHASRATSYIQMDNRYIVGSHNYFI